jgi:hypothetical protein
VVDLKRLATALGYGKTVLRLGPADLLWQCLHVVQGHVSPLALPQITPPAQPMVRTRAQPCVRGACRTTCHIVGPAPP